MTTPLAVVRTGCALAITAVLLNGVCAALIALWPAESISFANAWMHGVDLQFVQTRRSNKGLTERKGRVAIAPDRRRRNAAADCGLLTSLASIGVI
jgi:hypothetical protein